MAPEVLFNTLFFTQFKEESYKKHTKTHTNTFTWYTKHRVLSSIVLQPLRRFVTPVCKKKEDH